MSFSLTLVILVDSKRIYFTSVHNLPSNCSSKCSSIRESDTVLIIERLTISEPPTVYELHMVTSNGW